MKGINYIDYQCQKSAYDAGVSGVYRAFLSSPKHPGVDIIHSVKNDYDIIVNLKNETLFKSWKSIFKRTTKLWNFDDVMNTFSGKPPTFVYSFNGKNVIEDDHW